MSRRRVGWQVPRTRPIEIECPHCKAKPLHPCKTASGWPIRGYHQRRKHEAAFINYLDVKGGFR